MTKEQTNHWARVAEDTVSPYNEQEAQKYIKRASERELLALIVCDGDEDMETPLLRSRGKERELIVAKLLGEDDE